MQNYTFGAVCHVTSATILHQWFRLDEICRPKKGVTELLFYTHIHVWHIYIHLVDFYGKCRWICQSHGCVMGFLWAFLASENFHGEKNIAAESNRHLSDKRAIGHLTFGTSEACHEAWNNFSPVSWIPDFKGMYAYIYIIYGPIIAFLMKVSSHGFHVEVNFSWHELT